jgi:hypothetical protein
VRRLGSTILAAAAVVFATAAPASALPVPEPNDDITRAHGPLAAATQYDGSFESAADVDFLVFYVDGPEQIQLTLTKQPVGSCSPDLDATLLNGDGKVVTVPGHLNPYEVPTNASNALIYTPPASGRFYLMLSTDDACTGDPYRVTLQPSDAITTSSPHQADAPTTSTTATAEPSDRITQAFGPLAGDTAYGATSETAGDRDWHVFYVNGARDIDVAVTKVGDGCDLVTNVVLLNGDGRRVTDGNNPATVGSNQIEHITVTTPGGGRYYVVVSDDCAGNAYQLRVSPADAISIAPLDVRPTEEANAVPEPNDSLAQAFSPLLGGTAYSGSIDAPTDRDYFRLLVPAGKTPDVAVTKVGDGCSPQIKAALFTEENALVDDLGVDSDTIRHLSQTTATDNFFYLRISGSCAGEPYQVRVEPPDSVVAAFPPKGGLQPPPQGGGTVSPTNSSACRRAKAAAKKAAANVRSAKRIVRRAKSRRAKVKAKKLLAKRQRQLKTAKSRQRRACR